MPVLPYCDFCNLIIFNGSGNIHGLFVLIGIIEIFPCFNLIGAVGNGDIDIIYIINIIGLAANFYRTGVLAFLIGNACNIAVRIILAVTVGSGCCNFSNVILFIQCQCNGNGAIPIIVQIIQIFVVFCFVVNLYGNIICIIECNILWFYFSAEYSLFCRTYHNSPWKPCPLWNHCCCFPLCCL